MNPKQNPNEREPVDEADAIRIHRQLLGDLNPEEFAKLERDLIVSPDLRRRFMRAIRLDMTLRDQTFGTSQMVPTVPVKSRWLQFSSVVTAIAALFLLAAIVVWRTAPAGENGTPAPAEVATLVDARNCTWAGGLTPVLDKRFSAGVLELTAGVAVFQFDGGSRLALQGPASLEIIGPKTARLHRGNATVRCEQGLYNFSLLTPTSTVVDLGTEFGVAVEADGASEVHVLDGAVEVADTLSKIEPGIRLLEAGQTLALASNGVENIVNGTSQNWIRDYSSPLDRHADAQPPRLIAHDPFPSNQTQPKPLSLGSGWKSTWWQATDKKAGGILMVPMTPLTKRDGSSGLALRLGGGVEIRRKLAEPIDPAVSKTVYVGLSMHRLFPELRDAKGRLSEGTFMLRSSADPTTVLGMGLSPLNYWVVAEQGGWERSDQPETGTGPFFIVAKIEFNPLSGNRVSMMAYENSEDIPDAEPGSWDFITQRQHTRMSALLDTVALRARQSAFKFGELSIGNSWQAVVNPSAAGQ